MNRSLGACLAFAGAVIAAYFGMIFDTSVPVGATYGNLPSRVNNLGLMNDRLIGVVVGVALGIAGIIILCSAHNHYSTQQTGHPQASVPPVPPSGFNCPIASALAYKPAALALPATSRPVWLRELGQRVNLSAYTPTQIEWAYLSGISPTNFAPFVGFVEAYRAWTRQNTGGSLWAGGLLSHHIDAWAARRLQR